MKIKKLHATDKKEDVYVIPFLEFYYDRLRIVEFEAIPEGKNPTPDYLIHTTKTNIEVKELHDQASNNSHAIWATVTSNIRKAVEASSKRPQVKGLYLINTPLNIKFTRDATRLQKAADTLLESISKPQDNIAIEGVTFSSKKISDQVDEIHFGGMGQAGAIDSAGIIHQNIQKQLKTANNQLIFQFKGVKPESKIILIANKYRMLLWDWDIYSAISYLYSDLLSYTGIDEIWFQTETKKGFDYKLLFKRSFFEDFEKGRVDTRDSNSAKLYSNWFPPLEKMGDDKKEKLLVLLKEFLKNNKPHQIFSRGAREEIERLGIWLSEQGRNKEVLWIVDQFINDPDPQIPPKYSGKAEFNYHLQIVKGDDPAIITTVLGHLAWVIQKLTLDKDFIIPALERTKKLLEHPNLYVKMEAMVPLCEISTRRRWLRDYDKSHGTHTFATFHKLAFSLLELAKYKAIARALVQVFYWYQDLNTDDALRVVTELKQSPESGPILIWFGLFRKRHYPDIPFNQTRLEKVLKDVITGPEKEYEDLQSNILWNFWKVLQDQPEEFEVFVPYIDLYLAKPYKKSAYHTLELIIEDWLNKRPDIVIHWFEKALDGMYDFIKANKGQGSTIWLSPEEVITYVAQNEPEKLLKIIEILKNLWIEGGYIGSPQAIFESYKDIPDPGFKLKARKQFKIWYSELRKLNPKIQPVNWSL